MRAHALLAVTLIASQSLAAAPETRRPIVVTVDDLPIASGNGHPDAADRRKITGDLLAVMKRHGITAVGFVKWDNLRGERELDLLKMWLDAGHELGNHTKSHPHYARTTADAYVADAEACRVLLSDFLGKHGKKLRLFRFPFLCEGDTPEKLDRMREYLARTAQQNLCPTIDDQDWSFEGPWVKARRAGDEQAMRRIGCDYQAGLRLAVRDQEHRGDRMTGRPLPQILLLHANEVGAAQWDELFTWLESEGHRFATVDEVLADPIFREPHRYVAPEGPGHWDRLLAEREAREAREEVEKLLAHHVETWNSGDIETFCQGYADDAVFLSPSGILHGRGEVLDRYRRRYPDRAAMGKLSLEILDVRTASGIEIQASGDARPGSVQAVSVAARYTLTYDGGKPPATGLTLIVLHPSADSWLIVQDASM